MSKAVDDAKVYMEEKKSGLKLSQNENKDAKQLSRIQHYEC